MKTGTERWTDRPATEAILLAGGVETPYRRAGRGPSVVLLLAAPDRHERSEEVFAALAEHATVVRPMPAAAVWRSDPSPAEQARVGPDQWLRDLLEGLGMRRPTLVLDAAAAAALDDFRLYDRELLHAWIELPDTPVGAAAAVVGAVARTFR